ncbi:MAG: nicotinate (nicotinamide) nucleotide adenylyltransferase [Treponema sp.]|nr:nicotinate (nicotinamide) nucleotide adenylyltransferase [Candidatus Treponema equifaecale]
MKIAILGGSYNPIHIGHLILADTVCKSLGYDKVLFIPTFIPPHKLMSDTVDAKHRLGMVQAAVKNDDRFIAESCEIDRGGVSYTWDTICFLEEKYKDQLTDKIGLIFGEDLMPDYDKWEKAKELAEKADLIIACRDSDDEENKNFCNLPTEKYGKNPMKNVTRENFPFPHKTVQNPRISVSSTEIRRKIAEGGAWRYLVSDGVFEYIKNGGLYGFSEV